MTTMWWLLPIALPLLAAGVALVPTSVLSSSREVRGWLLVVAPLPGLVLGLLGAPSEAPRLGWLLLDPALHLDVVGRLVLVMTAVVWMLAGASARRLAARAPGFAAMFLVTLAGNVGVVLAGDVVTLYVMFAVMTFAAYALVVHERTPFALRAGRVYVVLSILGEVALLAGMVLAVGASEGTGFADIQAGIVGADGWERHGIVGLFICGFGVKAGIVPLHVWLPLAHPAAPVPASAVLSGAMIKAGLIGWLRVLPLGGAALEGWAVFLVAVGLTGLFFGAVVGILQREAKVVLAYSSVSQMGLMTVIVGGGLWDPEAGGLAAVAAATYAVHHGLAKAALFLGIGVHKGGIAPSQNRWLLAGMSVAALALAGAPFTSGWLAKKIAKDVVDLLPAGTATTLTFLLSLGAAGTTLLMLRVMWLLRAPDPEAQTDRALLVPWGLLLVAVAGVTWWLPPAWAAQVDVPMPALGEVWDGAWPVLLGLGLAAGWLWFGRRWGPVARLPVVPPGDAIVLFEAVGPPARGLAERAARPLRAAGEVRKVGMSSVRLAVLPGRGVGRVEEWLTRWQVAGVLFVLVTAALIAALTIGR